MPEDERAGVSEKKWCPKCCQWLDPWMFYGKADRKQGYCRTCKSLEGIERRDRDKELIALGGELVKRSERMVARVAGLGIRGLEAETDGVMETVREIRRRSVPRPFPKASPGS